MPGRDRTGPSGDGPRTGRGLGPCEGGLRRGCGRGRGYRRIGFQSAGISTVELSKDQQIKILEEDKADIEAKLKELKDA